MSLNLTIDQGNTAAKLALWHDERLVKVRIEERLTPAAVDRFLGVHVPVDQAIYCSVKSQGEEIMAKLSEVARRAMRLRSDMPLPISIEYGTPGTLGADRIAAAVGAWDMMEGESILVVDAGTAVTYDAVTPDGRFIGGNIAPGMNMRLEALHRFTARLPRVAVPRTIPTERFLGNDTASAMILGAVYGIVGAVTYYHSRLPKGTRIVMTGGWANEIGRLCDAPVTVAPNLVSQGLNRILIYNEDK